jgi:hypothetical protein
MRITYRATATEAEQWSRIHEQGLILLPLACGRIWAGHFLEVDSPAGKLRFRVARRSRAVTVESLSEDDARAACFPSVAPGSLGAWWNGLPHGLQSRAQAVWVSSRRASPSAARPAS